MPEYLPEYPPNISLESAKPESAVEPGDEVQWEGLAISPQYDAAMLK
jgi:hypothetical protein